MLVTPTAQAAKIDIEGLEYGMSIDAVRQILQRNCQDEPKEVEIQTPMPLHQITCKDKSDSDILVDFDFLRLTVTYIELSFRTSLAESEIIKQIQQQFEKTASSEPDIDSVASWQLTDEGDVLDLVHYNMWNIQHNIHDPARYSVVLSRKSKKTAPPSKMPPL